METLIVHYDVQSISEGNRFSVMERVNPFHEKLKLAKGRTMEELYRNVEIGNEAIFVRITGSEPKDIAVVVQRVKDINIGGHPYRIVKRLLRAVDQDYAGNGFGSGLTDETVQRLHPDAFTGRTPNPYVFRSDEKSEHTDTIYPIHQRFDEGSRLILAAALDESSLAEMNMTTGRCREVYPKGQADRLFSLENASERVTEIFGLMTKDLGVDLDNGDGIRYLTTVKHDPRGSSRFDFLAA